MKKHRALLGVWGFVGGSIPEDSISSVYCVWWRLSTVFPRGRSSVYDYKLCVPEGDNSVQGEKWKPCVKWERKFCAVLYAQRSSVLNYRSSVLK